MKATFNAALALLSLHCQIQLGRRSGLYGTAAMGTQAGGRFLNSVCELNTSLTAHELLSVLQSVENQLGRQRDLRWGPRTLDLDLLTYGEEVVNQSNLTVPHPALTHRRFVLDPLLEVDKNWRHPVVSFTTEQLIERINQRQLKISLVGALPEQSKMLAEKLQSRFPQVLVIEWELDDDECLKIQTSETLFYPSAAVIDLRHSPGDLLEKVTSALTAMFDVPSRISDW